ncbi:MULTISPECIES: helix-turn-helix domain-containing protein [unclassified Rhizobium]|uniref:helix-turn-helix domain-containing protein n=1 Tax=unclassified Rhizobium TaxID=2613769 RepID=UPI0007EA09BD|nr:MULTISPECIES: hypothetical protein [unclassified Rhizobium]ANL12042.1 hypothetical protein AMJ98_PA00096 [Rhizobium sp. N1341]ANM42887.1 hypothetical protein AMK03_PA00096 [Rhizobium sp. N741]
MLKKTEARTPKNVELIKQLRDRNVPNGQIADILNVSRATVSRVVAENDMPRAVSKGGRRKKVDTITAPITLEEMAARPKAQTITERRAVRYVPPMTDAEKAEGYRREVSKAVQWSLALSRGELPLAAEFKNWSDRISGSRDDNPFRLKARICEFNRDRRAILEDIEGEIDKAFRKFRTLAGPNTRIEDPEIFNLLSIDARASYDHLQALMAAARHLRLANGEITETAIHLHKAGAAATRATA